MAYDINLADRVRACLNRRTGIEVEEKKMFGGLAFMINGKMCVNVSHGQLMCRFDPALTEEIAERKGFSPMVMKGRAYQGYCYVAPEGFSRPKDFAFWIDLCLDLNDSAKSSRKTKKRQAGCLPSVLASKQLPFPPRVDELFAWLSICREAGDLA